MKQFQYAANMDERGLPDIGLLMAMGLLAGQYGKFMQQGAPADVLPGTIGGAGAGSLGGYMGYRGHKDQVAGPEAWKSLGPEWSQEAANEQLFGPKLTIMNILSALGRLGQRR